MRCRRLRRALTLGRQVAVAPVRRRSANRADDLGERTLEGFERSVSGPCIAQAALHLPLRRAQDRVQSGTFNPWSVANNQLDTLIGVRETDSYDRRWRRDEAI